MMNQLRRYCYLLVLAAFVVVTQTGCNKSEELDPSVESEERLTKRYDGETAVAWMDMFTDVVKSEGKNPPNASRIFGYAGVTLYESVVAGMPMNRSLQGQVNGLGGLPKANYKILYDFPTVSNEALYILSKNIFGTLKPDNQARFDSLYNAIKTTRQQKVKHPSIFNVSVNYGKAVGNAILPWINADNWTQTRSMVYTVPSRSVNPMFWVPTGPVTNPLEPFWGTLRPFCMANGGSCYIPSQIPFSTNTASDFYAAAYEVYNTKLNLDQEQTNIALWWADGGGTYTPPGHWMRIAGQIIEEDELNLARAAEVYALLGMGVADAFISCWEAKYRYNLLRPVTYIKENIDPNWTPLIATPPFPEYTSGHSVCSGAAAQLLTNTLGVRSFADSTNISILSTTSPRSFNSFNEAADEAAISRLYGGIHYREAIELGVQQGRTVANTITQRVKLKKGY